MLPDRLSRYAAVATLFLKYGRSNAGPTTPGALPTEVTKPDEDAETPEQLARVLEALGPTFVKLGQVLSSRLDLMDARYIEALARLQDNVKPFPFPDVQAIIEADLGVRLSKAFATFDEKPSRPPPKEFAEKLPGRVNRVLDSLAASELKMKVELIDDGAIISGLQKVANRITLGLILASLIVGAAMMMRIETNFRIMGYPGLAMILFTLAATGAGYLAVQILMHDRVPKRR